jgi:hypothetical protein
MHVAAFILGSLFCFGVILDAFQTIILPRRPTKRWRLTRFFYILTWTPWVWLGEHIPNRKLRKQLYAVFGPLSLILLLIVWAVLLIGGFGLLYFALGSPFGDQLKNSGSALALLRQDCYVSGTTLFTLGLGDVVPQSHLVRALVVLESGTGLGFVALVIGYVPVLYQTFSRREVSVAMLDGRAGSPPTATELLRRHGHEGGDQELIELLAEWERWSAEILESHISYPILCYYRSQHDTQSWLAALVAILDACSLLITTVQGPSVRQAQLTFAMARHALIDIGSVFSVEERFEALAVMRTERLPDEQFNHLCETLGEMHMRLCGDADSRQRLTAIRQLYEPHALALGDYIKMPLPPWVAPRKKADLWTKVAGLRRIAHSHVSENSTAAHLHGEH